MKIEYLLENNDQIEYYKTIELFDVEKNIIDIPNKDIKKLIVQIKGQSESTANSLSNVHDKIQKEKYLTVLINESSQYYVKNLFLYVNELEYLIRKVLRLASSLNKNDDASDGKKYIEQLDLKTLGEIFEFLFTDTKFNDKIRNLFNDKIKSIYSEEKISRQITKKQLINRIESWEEKTPWEILLEDRVPTLNENYIEIVNIRNNVAHAHHISFEMFETSKKLITKVLSELRGVIRNIEKSDKDLEFTQDFNSKLTETLISYEKSKVDLEKKFILKNYLLIKEKEDISNNLIKKWANELLDNETELSESDKLENELKNILTKIHGFIENEK